MSTIPFDDLDSSGLQNEPTVPGAKRPTRASADDGEQITVRAFLSAHGFDSPERLVFGVVLMLPPLLFAAFALIVRWTHFEAWHWGQQMLNRPLAFAGSSAMLAALGGAFWATRSAYLGRTIPAAIGLSVVTLGCATFVATVGIELDAKSAYGISPGDAFHPSERYSALRFGVHLPKNSSAAIAEPVTAAPLRKVDSAYGRTLFLKTCASCHGPQAHGLPGQGKDLNNNEFVGTKNEMTLLDFVKVGRQPWDPLNTTKVQMPPRGGNPALSDDDLRDIVAFVLTLQTGGPKSAGGVLAASQPGNAVAAAAAESKMDLETMLLVHRFVAGSPNLGPTGVASMAAGGIRPYWKAPTDGAAFAGAFYCVASLTALMAALPALAAGGLLCAVWRRSSVHSMRAPVALCSCGCATVAAYWFLMFPLIYVL